jgi:CHAT domain-containing protein
VIQPWLDQIGGEPTAIRIVATGWLAQCPLHAATVRGPHGDAPCPLLDRVAVSFAPNARAITLARDRAAARRGRRLLAVGDPQPSSAARLPLARAEVSQVAAAYPGATVLLADDATLARVRAELPSADVLHLACHGFAAPLHPEASALLLSADERLTLGDLIRSQVTARVVFLSACETAISGFSLPDEVVALPTSFLQAGAAGVIGSLWRVPDSAAAVLMAEVHARLLAAADPGDPSAALGQAQRWLRAATNEQLLARWPELLPSRGPASGFARELWLAGQPFTDPSNWAPFIFVGA